MTTKKLVVDFDGVLFKAALRGETPMPTKDAHNGSYLWHRIHTTEFDARKAHKYIEAFLGPLNEAYDEVVLAVSDEKRRYWRHDVLPSYKGGRKKQERPLGMTVVDKWFSLPVERHTNMEADDVCSVYMTKGYHCYSPDKDLKTVAGTLISYGHSYANSCAFGEASEEPEEEWAIGEPTERTEEEAFWFFCWQCLVGDNCDGLPGCPGIAEKKANKLLDPLKEATKKDMWTAVAKAYEGKAPKAPLMQQAQCLRMKRAFDEPLWTPTMEGITYGM